MIITTNIWSFPILTLLWAADAISYVLAARIILSLFSGTRAGRVATMLGEFTDPVLNRIQRRLTRWRGRPVPAWTCWLVLASLILLIRHLLICTLVAVAGVPGGRL